MSKEKISMISRSCLYVSMFLTGYCAAQFMKQNYGLLVISLFIIFVVLDIICCTIWIKTSNKINTEKQERFNRLFDALKK